MGGERFCDLVEFPPLEKGNEEGFGEQVVVVAQAPDALVAARGAVGAGVDRRVNQGMVGDEYRD